MITRAAASIATVLTVAGCGRDDGQAAEATAPCTSATEASVRIHRGLPPHDVVDPDAVLDVEYGAQGGMHLRLAVSCAGLDPGSPTLEDGLANGDLPEVTWEVSVPSEALTASSPHRAVRQAELDGRTLLQPQLVVLRYYESPPASFDVPAREAELESLPATVEVSVTDRCDRSASDAADVRLRFPRDGG